MEYNATAGAWLKAETVQDGAKVKLMNECVQQTSKFKDEKTGEPKTENVVKARFEGMDDVVNMRVNWTSIYGLIEAFGKDSKDWIGHTLTARVKDATTGVSIYLVPDGFEVVRNKDTKRWEVRKAEAVIQADEKSAGETAFETARNAPEINPDDITFD